jgi:hypothetical protein
MTEIPVVPEMPAPTAPSLFAALFPARYRYTRDLTPALDLPLDPDAAVAHLRDHLFYEAHNHRFYRARSASLAADVAALRAEVVALRARVASLEAADAAA